MGPDEEVWVSIKALLSGIRDIPQERFLAETYFPDFSLVVIFVGE